MNLVKVIYNEKLNMCGEFLIQKNLPPDLAMKTLKSANYPAYIYSPELINTDAYFLMELKNKKCIKEYKKVKD